MGYLIKENKMDIEGERLEVGEYGVISWIFSFSLYYNYLDGVCKY